MPAPPTSCWHPPAPSAPNMLCSQPPVRARVESSCTPYSRRCPETAHVCGLPRVCRLPMCVQTSHMCADCRVYADFPCVWGGLRGCCSEVPAPATSLRPRPCVCDTVWGRCPAGTGGVQAGVTSPGSAPLWPPRLLPPSPALLGETCGLQWAPQALRTASRHESRSWPQCFRSRPGGNIASRVPGQALRPPARPPGPPAPTLSLSP